MPSLRILILLVVVALLQCVTVLGAPRLPAPLDSAVASTNCSTNAECLRRGLPILPATRSRARREVVPGPSQMVDSYSFQFRLAVHVNGVKYFYLSSQTYSGAYYIDLTNNAGLAMKLATNVAPGSSSSGGINIRVVDAPSPGYQWLGIRPAHSQNDNMSPAYSLQHHAYTHISDTQTTPNSRPVTSANLWDGALGRSTPVPSWESAVWYYNLATNTVTPIWTNPDPAVYGAQTTLFPAIYNSDFLILQGNPNAFGASVQACTLVVERF